MNSIQSFCCFGTHNSLHELCGLLYSIALYHPDTPLYILTDTASVPICNQVTNHIPNPVHIKTTLDKYGAFSRNEMVKNQLWNEFMMSKADALEWALENHDNAMYLDCDQLVVNTLKAPPLEYEIGVSPHYCSSKITRKFGYYNGGLLFARNKKVPNLWRKYAQTSSFFDQKAIEDLCTLSYFEYSEQYNIGLYRFNHDKLSNYKHFNIGNNQLLYKNAPAVTIHTHFGNKTYTTLNRIVYDKLKLANQWKVCLIIQRIQQHFWKITLPLKPQTNKTTHNLRDLCKSWANKHPDLKLVTNSQTRHLWFGQDQLILLYDQPNLHSVDKQCFGPKLILCNSANAPMLDKFAKVTSKYNTQVEPFNTKTFQTLIHTMLYTI